MCEFEKLNVTTVVAPTLKIVNPNKLFVLEMDGFGEAICVILMKEGHFMVFESKKLEHAQCNYSTYEGELFSIVPALKKWKQYFLIVK